MFYLIVIADMVAIKQMLREIKQNNYFIVTFNLVLTSLWPEANPGVQAVSRQVTF